MRRQVRGIKVGSEMMQIFVYLLLENEQFLYCDRLILRDPYALIHRSR